MQLTVVGCGDAFGSGGRLQTCYCVDTDSERFLIDCGATVLIGLDRLGIDPDSIGTILISHLHGDHFGGLVWWLLHAQHVSRRTAPLTVAGPVGIEARFVAAAEALFPGSTSVKRRYALSFHEYPLDQCLAVGPVRVTAREVLHPSGAPPCALRIEVEGKTIAFTGDTEWVEALVPTGAGADLYIMECFSWDGAIRYHLTWQIIQANLARIGARRVLLTHMSNDMLRRAHEVQVPSVEVSHDGLVIDL